MRHLTRMYLIGLVFIGFLGHFIFKYWGVGPWLVSLLVFGLFGWEAGAAQSEQV